MSPLNSQVPPASNDTESDSDPDRSAPLPPPPCRRPVVQAALVQSWIAADAGMKKQVKQNLLATLGTQVRLGWALGQPGGGCAAGA